MNFTNFLLTNILPTRRLIDCYRPMCKDTNKMVQTRANEVGSILSEDSFWFPPLKAVEFDIHCREIGEHRETLARKNLKAWLEKVGLPYHSPHKFRHGHIHFGVSFSKTYSDYKAVSLNVMHSSIEITDQFYSVLNED